MLIRIVAPVGNKLRDIRTDKEHSEVICDEKYRDRYILVGSDEDPVVETVDGVTLSDRVSDLEDAVVELAGIITEGETDEAITEEEVND